MKNDSAQIGEVRPLTPGQMKELCTTVMQGIPTDMSFEVVNDVLGHKSELIAHVRAYFRRSEDMACPVKVWECFYRKYLGLAVDLSGVRIPERTPAQAKEFTRLLIVAKDLTRNQVYDACHRTFNVQCSRCVDDLDASFSTNQRAPYGSYAIWVRDVVEADEIHRNKSAVTVARERLKTETLLERLLHGLKYFAETGKHLDKVSGTLCSGSSSDGAIPYVQSPSCFRVALYSSVARRDSLSHREVVS